MPPPALHVTVATLRLYTAEDLPAGSEARARATAAWIRVLDDARASWGTPDVSLTFHTPTFRGNCATLSVADADGAIAGLRAALGDAVAAHGGRAVVGAEPRDRGRPPAGLAPSDPAPHLPDICHSTILRWADEPDDREAAGRAFDAAAATFPPVTTRVPAVAAVFEEAPFMHQATPFWTAPLGKEPLS